MCPQWRFFFRFHDYIINVMSQRDIWWHTHTYMHIYMCRYIKTLEFKCRGCFILRSLFKQKLKSHTENIHMEYFVGEISTLWHKVVAVKYSKCHKNVTCKCVLTTHSYIDVWGTFVYSASEENPLCDVFMWAWVMMIIKSCLYTFCIILCPLPYYRGNVLL